MFCYDCEMLLHLSLLTVSWGVANHVKKGVTTACTWCHMHTKNINTNWGQHVHNNQRRKEEGSRVKCNSINILLCCAQKANQQLSSMSRKDSSQYSVSNQHIDWMISNQNKIGQGSIMEENRWKIWKINIQIIYSGAQKIHLLVGTLNNETKFV